MSWHWIVMQSLKKNWLMVPKITWGIWWILIQVWKFELWCATLVESLLCMSQKSTEELCVITLRNDAKVEEELTCPLKNDMKNLADFDPTSKVSKFALWCARFVQSI